MTPPLTKTQEKQLGNLYYVDNNLFGRDKLFDLIKKNGYTISRRQVMEWLKTQEIHQLYQPTRKTKDIKPSLFHKPNQQIGIDLADMQNQESNGNRFILTAIDLFSKKAYARPIKNKMDKTVTIAMESIIKEIKKPISSIRSDQGAEFDNKPFEKLMNKYNIKHIFTLPGKPQSNGQVERFNGILKQLLNKYIKIHKTSHWDDGIDELISNYNNTQSRITKMTPNDIHRKNYDKEVQENIKNAIIPKNDNLTQKFQKGDNVRIKIDPDNITKQKWSKQIYTIKTVHRSKSEFNAIGYTLEGQKQRFYTNDLLKVTDIKNPIEEEKKYKVKKLIKPLIQNEKPSYEVQWFNYKETTIEPRSSLIEDIPKMIRRFENRHSVKFLKKKVEWNK